MELGERLPGLLKQMQQDELLVVRELVVPEGANEPCYYSKTLYFDELYVAKKISGMNKIASVDKERVEQWISRYCQAKGIALIDEQAAAVKSIVGERFSILTGGPGCGKTTTTEVLVKMLEAMKLKVLLAAPTGRAAQRMTEVIGNESKTIHRLLEWQVGKFKKNEDHPLDVDFLIKGAGLNNESAMDTNLYEFRTHEAVVPYETELNIPTKFQHVDIEKIFAAQTRVEELLAVLKKVHPWSSLHYGLSACRCGQETLLWNGYRNIWGTELKSRSSLP